MSDAEGPARRRVAVIGGGVAGLFTALALSDPRLEGRYDITIYSRGWRLGGKCASGRNTARHDRIEEHGLHLWFGFYDNAFAWVRRCLDALPSELRAPHRGVDTSFAGFDDVVLYEEWPNHEHVQKVSALRLCFPPDGGEPGGSQVPSFGATVRRVAEVLAATADAMFAGAVPFGPGRAFAHLVGIGARLGVRLVPRRLGAVPGTRPGPISRVRLRLLLLLLRGTRALALHMLDPLSGRGEGRRRQLFTGLDLLCAALRGIVEDRLLEVGFGTIDGVELREWLVDNGAAAQSVGSGSVLWALYDLVFGYHRGEVGVPELAAGRALLALLRLLGGYHGHFGYRMSSSMGEVVLAPLYELLRSRGVRVAFFRDLRAVHLDDDDRLASVELHRQADVDVDGFDPFAWTGPDGPRHWPIEPDWAAIGLDPNQVSAEQLEDGLPVEAGEPRETLEVGVDVDHVVLAVPAPVLADPRLHADLARLPGWRRALEHSASVATIAYQVWSDRPGSATAELNERFGRAVVSSYDQPFSTYCPMDQLAAVEDWAGRDVHIGYGCGVWPEPIQHRLDALRAARPEPTDDVELAAVQDEAARSLARLRVLPDPPSRGVASVLRRRTAPAPPARGPARPDGGADPALAAATADHTLWVRLNDKPAHRYVTTPPTNPWFRIAPDRTGVESLFVAGDWTSNLLDGGCVEATVISALWAARGIARRDGVADAVLADCFSVTGEHTWLDHGGPAGAAERSRRQSPYAAGTASSQPGGEQRRGRATVPGAPGPPNDAARTAWDNPTRVGALTSVPGPYSSNGTTLYAWLAEVDPDRAAAVAQRCFADMTGGEVQAEPIGSLAMITAGDIASVSSLAPAYRRLGKLGERQVVIWLPCHVRWGRDLVANGAGRSEPPSFAMFVPYIWVDNPMSLTTGREGLGWPKAMAGFTPATGISLPLSLTAYGLGTYGPDAVVDAALPLLSITAADEDELDEVVSLAELAARLSAAAADAFGTDALEAIAAVVTALHTKALPQLFAKSHIAATDVADDDFLSVVTAAATVLHWRDARLIGPCDLVVHDVASHPVRADLGLRSQTMPVGFRIELDFRQESGTLRWSSWASPRQRRSRARTVRERRLDRTGPAGAGPRPAPPGRRPFERMPGGLRGRGRRG